MQCSSLRAEIARKNKTNRALASKLGLSEQAFYNKVNGKTEFKNSEMLTLAEELDLSMEDVNVIFFDAKVN